ncbi:AtaL-like protein [Chitinibacteraceae bacterium HSL-7]
MQFEHLVAVNGEHDEMAIGRDTLWQGLLLRARAPQRFLPHIEAVALSAEHAGGFVRVIDFGSMQVTDTVTLDAGERMVFTTAAAATHGASRLEVTIEEPEGGALFVRFAYDTPVPEEAVDGIDFAGYLRETYRQVDVAAVQLIRQLAHEGGL